MSDPTRVCYHCMQEVAGQEEFCRRCGRDLMADDPRWERPPRTPPYVLLYRIGPFAILAGLGLVAAGANPALGDSGGQGVFWLGMAIAAGGCGVLAVAWKTRPRYRE